MSIFVGILIFCAGLCAGMSLLALAISIMNREEVIDCGESEDWIAGGD